MKIIHNRIRCKLCGDIIESNNVHDFVTCSCKASSVDGGKKYLRRAYKQEGCYEDISVVSYEEENERTPHDKELKEILKDSNDQFEKSNILTLLIAKRYKELYPKGAALYFYSDSEKAGVSSILRNIYYNAVKSGVKTAFFSALDFYEMYIISITSPGNNNWYERLRKNTELLIIDDLHLISSKEATLEELTMVMKHIIDEKQGHIILGSHCFMNKLYGAPKEFIALIEGHSFPVSLA